MIFLRPVEDPEGVGGGVVAAGAVGVVGGAVDGTVGTVGVVVGFVGLGCARGGGGFGAATGTGSGGGGSGVVVAGGGGAGSPATDAGAGGASTCGSSVTSSDELPLRITKKAVVRPPMTTNAPSPISASVGPELLGRGREGTGAEYSPPLPGSAGAPPA